MLVRVFWVTPCHFTETTYARHHRFSPFRGVFLKLHTPNRIQHLITHPHLLISKNAVPAKMPMQLEQEFASWFRQVIVLNPKCAHKFLSKFRTLEDDPEIHDDRSLSKEQHWWVPTALPSHNTCRRIALGGSFDPDPSWRNTIGEFRPPYQVTIPEWYDSSSNLKPKNVCIHVRSLIKIRKTTVRNFNQAL